MVTPLLLSIRLWVRLEDGRTLDTTLTHPSVPARLPSSSQSVAQLRLFFANPASRNTYANFSAPEVLLYLSARFRIDVPQAKTLVSEVFWYMSCDRTPVA